MKIGLFYFSGTGNTWWLCERFKEMAETKGAEVSLHAIDELMASNTASIADVWADNEVVGLAYPVHSSDAPPILYRFLEKVRMEVGDHPSGPKEAFVLTTMQSFSGDGALMLREGLESLGVELKVSKDFRMSANTGVPILTFNPSKDQVLEEQMVKNLEVLEEIVDHILAGRRMLKVQYGEFGRFHGWLQRVGPKWKDRTWRYFAAHPDRCTRCLICVEQCPVGAISVTDEDLVWDRSCTDCFRCYNFCPERAITVKGLAMGRRQRQHTYFRDRGFPPR